MAVGSGGKARAPRRATIIHEEEEVWDFEDRNCAIEGGAAAGVGGTEGSQPHTFVLVSFIFYVLFALLVFVSVWRNLIFCRVQSRGIFVHARPRCKPCNMTRRE